ncbi:MAG TPA: ATP-binding protein [Candidatus Saccharimonadales bacterium]|jgi:signal transduction histidine kinase|nr:ATP-binding protein [Candidatus Saccharimonadales bacterium]
MKPPNYHQLLFDQVRQTLGDAQELSGPLQALLEQVSDTYVKLEAEVGLRTEQLMASTSRAYSFLDSLNMGFIMCDVTGEVVLANSSVRQMLSTPVAEVEPRWTLDVIDGLLQPSLQLKQLIKQCLATGQPVEYNQVTVGQRTLLLFIAPLTAETTATDKQLLGAVILVEDITEQKLLERSKDEFLSIASHELRTPLTAIRGNASLISQYYGDQLPDQRMAAMISDIHESSTRLIDIVNDFLDVSAIEQGKMVMNPEAFGLAEIVDEATRELQALCQSKGLTLQKDASVDAAPPVRADKMRIKQVIYNLIGNAIKFTEEGGITVSADFDDSMVTTSVSDTGKGLSPASQRLLFHKFQQAGSSLLTRDATKGTGLGLYISKLIVEHSGGQIGLASSELGKGSTFAFSLPRAA